MRTSSHRLVKSVAATLAQFMSAMAVTFVVSLVVRAETFQYTRPSLFALALGLAFTTGIYLAGWIALRLHVLDGSPRGLARLGGVVVGTYLPLIVALLAYGVLEPGNPFFLVSLLAGSLGYQAPGWSVLSQSPK